MVNAYSPEAMEEILWMQFFAYLHDPTVNNAAERQTSHPEFEAVYAATLAKLLLCRDADRIVCKNNYNITRIAYLAKLYEDARFVIAVRHPVAHIASMARQHQRNLAHFCIPDSPSVSAQRRPLRVWPRAHSHHHRRGENAAHPNAVERRARYRRVG